MSAPVTVPTFDDTVRGAKLLRKLEEQWANLSVDDDGEELELQFVRAAYGAGYTDALEESRA